MPPPDYTELRGSLRERISSFRLNFRQFRADVREDPTLLWRTQPIRIAFWILVGLGLILFVRWLAVSITPTPSFPGEYEPTRTATLWVACTNPDCLKTSMHTAPMDFNAWPVACEHCGNPSAVRAVRCPLCRSLMPPAEGDSSGPCVRCATPVRKTAAPVASRPSDPDDREDGWPD